MISDKEIEEKAIEFGLRTLDVQRDYVYGWLLAGLAQRPILSSQLVLKGGNALRKGYLPDTRFSKDLDFSCLSEITQSVLEAELREVCSFVAQHTGIQFIDKVVSRDKNLAIPGVQATEARLYFKSFFGEENLKVRTQVDITQFDRIYLPVQTKQIIHPYTDASNLVASMRFQKIEEILASKLTTLLHRRNPVDLFDLLYSTVFKNEYPINRLELISTFLRKSIFGSEPLAAREELRSVKIGGFRDLWKSLIVPATSLFNFDYALTNFQNLIDSLFILLPSSLRPSDAPTSRLFRQGGNSETRNVGGYRNYFPSEIRHTIIEAGRTLKMIALSYDGFERLVEPYKLEYYTRKSDNRSLEYFWGYDTTGGRSRQISIKQFVCDKIQSVKLTGQSFQPRYTIEL